jgi:hypothetical protein
MGRYKKLQYYCRPLKMPIPKITLIFGIDRLKTADTNNVLLISVDNSIIISIDYCYQLMPIINLICYNKLFF